MAVLTPLAPEDARELVASYGIGALLRVDGIPAGSVNSNFALTVDGGRYFLRLYEERDVAGARRETAMLQELARRGVPTPAPLHRTDGELVSVVRGKAAAIFPWRDGGMRCQASVTARDAHAVGRALASVHLAGEGQACEEGRFGFRELLARLDVIAASDDRSFSELAPVIRGKLEATHAARSRDLPGGLTHGDLFRDNVLWTGDGSIAALLDFESACAGTFPYDLMVTVLAWCVGDELDPALARALCEGYQAVRPLTEGERRALAVEGRFAALRFTITRITDYALRRSAAGPRTLKDWRRFWKRYEALDALGAEGVRAMLAV